MPISIIKNKKLNFQFHKVSNPAPWREATYQSVFFKPLLEYMEKQEAEQYYRDKIAEEGEKLGNLYDSKRMFLAVRDNPDWFITLGLELLNERIVKQQKIIKGLVFKLDVLTGIRKEAYRVHDLDAIKAIPIADIMPCEPRQRATNRLYYLSPWRTESNPSLVVYVDSNRFHDFGEDLSGTVIDMYMKLNDCDFREAVKELNQMI